MNSTTNEISTRSLDGHTIPERARVLLEINNAIVSRLDLVGVLKAVSECLRREIRHEFASLAIYNAERNELRLHALETLAVRLADAGRFASAVEAALAAVRAEPLRESANRCLVTVHLAEGNSMEALRAYETFRQALSADLGMQPSIRMSVLVASLTNA